MQQANDSQEALLPALTALKSCHAHHFDPLRFCYIESMARRAEARAEAEAEAGSESGGWSRSRPVKASLAVHIESQARKALTAYLSDFQLAQKAARPLAARIAAEFPTAAEQAQRLFNTCEFKALQRLLASLELRHRTRPLTALLKEISVDEEASTGEKAHSGFNASSMPAGFPGMAQAGELKSVRLFRESWQKRQTDKLVTQAIAQGPESPGPLNPQMLMIRSLTILRDLSPAYSNRFVSYLDTLLWLDEIGEKDEPGKQQKGQSKTQQQGKVRQGKARQEQQAN